MFQKQQVFICSDAYCAGSSKSVAVRYHGFDVWLPDGSAMTPTPNLLCRIFDTQSQGPLTHADLGSDRGLCYGEIALSIAKAISKPAGKQFTCR